MDFALFFLWRYRILGPKKSFDGRCYKINKIHHNTSQFYLLFSSDEGHSEVWSISQILGSNSLGETW